MKAWLAGLFVLLLLIGTCGQQDDVAEESGAPAQGAPLTEPGGRADERAAKRARARRAARLRRQAKARRVRAARARARARREAAAAAALQAEREAAEALEAEQEAAEQVASSCDPNYEGACLDAGSPDYDCEGGSGDGPHYTGTVYVVGHDPFDLDRDGDGVGCDT